MQATNEFHAGPAVKAARPEVNVRVQQAASTDLFPDGKSAQGKSIPVDEDFTAAAYAVRIKAILDKTVDGIFEAARVVCAASEKLGKGEYLRLAALTGMSVGTLNKLKTIHERSARFADVMDALPATWTNIYELARLDDDQFALLRETRRLRPDLTGDEIKECSRRSQAGAREGLNRPLPTEREPHGARRRLAVTIMISEDLPQEGIDQIRIKIEEALKGQPVFLDFPEEAGKVRERTRRNLVPALQTKLKEFLSNGGSGGELSVSDREVVDNAAWQFHHKKQKGEYPYPPSDPLSVQHAEHLYSVRRYKDPASFLKHLRAKKIITPYSPLSEFAELGEARCVRYALDFCSAASPKVRRSSRERLAEMMSKEPMYADVAQRYLNVIAGREAL
jgi:hypothetical protein